MKHKMKANIAVAGLAFALAFGGVAPAAAQAARKSAISRSMEQAIRLYHEGQDSEAMDRFMDILVKGSPSEKALANEYISKITLRMNTGVNTVKDSGAETSALNEVEESGPARPAARTTKASVDYDAGEEPGEEAPEDEAAGQQSRVADKISSKIAQMRRDLLLELGRSNSVKVYMGEGTPKAITLDTNFFFASETSFRAGTDKMLGTLAGLVFTLGKANLLILPEGSAEGDVKIKSIRRALALNSYFESRGISKSRLDINLTGADVRFPKELTNINGLIILFDYDKSPKLKDLEDLQTKGPKVSLGVYPTAISVQQNEGAIVEFSAFESPIGQPSWKFQIFQVLKDGSRLQLQEISGTGPQYNQSYWNGRKKFFGAPYAAGKYMFTVSAADTEGRETSLSRLLVVRPGPEEERKQQAAAAARQEHSDTVTAAGVKTRTVGAAGASKASGKVLKGAAKKAAAAAAARKKAALKAKKAPAKKTARKPAPASEEAAPADDGSAAGAAEEPKQPAVSSQVNYKIYFKENTLTLTENSEKRLAQVAETLSYYPMAKIMLTGYAYSGEADAETMAEKRVNRVAARLSEKYSIDQSRMQLQSKVSETPKSTVEIRMSGNE